MYTESAPYQNYGRLVRTFVFPNGHTVAAWLTPEGAVPYSAEFWGHEWPEPDGHMVEEYYDLHLSYDNQAGAPLLVDYDGCPDLPEEVRQVLGESFGVAFDECV